MFIMYQQLLQVHTSYTVMNKQTIENVWHLTFPAPWLPLFAFPYQVFLKVLFGAAVSWFQVVC